MDIDKGMRIGAEAPEWQDREGRTKVGPEYWGTDHWSLFRQVATEFAARGGKVNWDRLTVSRKNWPMLWAERSQMARGPFAYDGSEYGVRLKRINRIALKGGSVTQHVLDDHCGVDALCDLVDHGVVERRMPTVSVSGEYYLNPAGNPMKGDGMPRPGDLTTGHVEWMLMPYAKFTLSQRGFRILAHLARFEAADENAAWTDFNPQDIKEVWG